ncbi:LysR family transcriptional regulator [Kutzneria sp. CA-103260]|uniref:LysR family transcriptional regulator n=1 Tax=Kutzneria sp. CA-103260 TaxID=2802641 RepID=UPI001BA4810E|nr:LysR family transcriptional regulator [Kutzneria sp. CA-103260]QUQ72309.1 LysR family transcriptional regulator [Kutzneria sp. CA-103260]
MTTLRALECLVALVDAGSVTAAAASLQMSQPALSHQIAALERELETPVMHRLGRGIRVTAAGLAAAEEARKALRAAADAVHIGRQVGAGEHGRLRIACAETMTAWLLPVLRQWRIRRPEVTLELAEHSSADRMVAAIAAGTVDLAVGPRPTATDEHLELLGEEEIVVVAPEGHAFAGAAVTMADLATQPFVHYTRDNGLSAWIDQLAAHHRVQLKPVLRTRSPRTAAQLAAAGIGVAIVPSSALTSRGSGVVCRLTPPIRRDIVVVVASPSDTLAARFAADLRQRGRPTEQGQGVPV